MKLRTLVHLIFCILFVWNLLKCVTYTIANDINRSAQYAESASDPHDMDVLEDTAANPFFIPSSPESQDLQQSQQSSVLTYNPCLISKLHSMITIDRDINQSLSTQTQTPTDKQFAIKMYNFCSIGELPFEITNLIVQFLEMNETDACLKINMKWRSATQPVIHELWRLMSEATIKKFITRPEVEQKLGSFNMKLNLPNDRLSRVLLSLLSVAFTSAKNRVLHKRSYRLHPVNITKTLNTNLKLFWLFEQYRTNRDYMYSNRFIVNTVNQSVNNQSVISQESVDNLTDKYIADLQHLISHVVDSAIASIEFNFNTIDHIWCMIADFATVSIMLEASLQLRVVVMQLWLERNDDTWNGTHIDDMYSNMKQTFLEYDDFIWNITQRAPLGVEVSIKEKYDSFYKRARQWLDLSKSIKIKYINKRTKPVTSKKKIMLLVGCQVFAIMIFIGGVVAYLVSK